MQGTPQPGHSLWELIKLGLRLRGSSLVTWCEDHGVNRRVARAACLGERNGPKARRLRQRLASEARVDRLRSLGGCDDGEV